jgi:hypothetical protein
MMKMTIGTTTTKRKKTTKKTGTDPGEISISVPSLLG